MSRSALVATATAMTTLCCSYSCNLNLQPCITFQLFWPYFSHANSLAANAPKPRPTNQSYTSLTRPGTTNGTCQKPQSKPISHDCCLSSLSRCVSWWIIQQFVAFICISLIYHLSDAHLYTYIYLHNFTITFLRNLHAFYCRLGVCIELTQPAINISLLALFATISAGRICWRFLN